MAASAVEGICNTKRRRSHRWVNSTLVIANGEWLLFNNLQGPVTTVFGIVELVSAMMLTSVPASSQVSGRARVVDGDTLKIGQEVVSLFGIDAPEAKQFCQSEEKLWPCGRRARDALHDHIGQNRVECFGAERDRQGRLLAVCLSGGEELNGWLVSEGWALARRPISNTYVDDEAAALTARRGIWDSNFVKPWEWRRGKRLKIGPLIVNQCKIKGTITNDGKKVYFLPSDQQYPLVQIMESTGELWFFSENEARAAGWRPSGR